VRKITGVGGAVPSAGNMITIAGGGSKTPAAGVMATSANLGRIAGVAVDPATGDVYFSDYDNHNVWKIAQTGATAGQLVAIAGIGTGGYNGDQADATQAQLNNPHHLNFQNGLLNIADRTNNRIRRVTTTVTPMPLATVAGTTSGGYSGDGDLAIVSQLNSPFGVTTDGSGNLFIADESNQRIREVPAATSKIQTVIGEGRAGFAGDGLSGRGVTLTASIAPGGPTYLPVTVGADIEQSTWQFLSTPSTTTGPALSFTVRQTSAAGSGMRMNSPTTFSLTPDVANVLSLPASLAIPNNGNTVSPTTYSISSVSRTSNAVTVTLSTAASFSTGQIVGISGVTDTSFNGVFTVTGPGSTTFTFTQAGPNATSTGGTVSTAATIGSGVAQIIAQASTTGIALGASSNITVTPVFTSLSPAAVTHGTTTPVTITGRNFLGATGITAPAGINASITNVSTDGSTMSASITVGSSVTAGPYTLSITTLTGNVNFTLTVN
jgi:hypothetical protein